MCKPAVWMAIAASALVMDYALAATANYPNKPIRMITSSVGGNGDFSARLLAQGLTEVFAQPVVVENRGGGVVPAYTVAHASADGYTLLAYGATLWTGALLQKTPYDPIQDFAPITSITNSPSVLTVHPSIPVKSVSELIAFAKARPGVLNYAAAQTGSPAHLGGELFKAMAGINMVAVPYKSAGSAVNDLLGGQVQVMFASAASIGTHIKAGRLKALAVTSAQPSALFPELPTVAAAGLPHYESGSKQGLWAPARTPASIIRRLNAEVRGVLNRPDVRDRILATGAEPTPSSPEQFAAAIRSEMMRMGKVIESAGIKADSNQD